MLVCFSFYFKHIVSLILQCSTVVIHKCFFFFAVTISNILCQAGLGRYIELFKQNEIDKDTLLLLTEADLEVLIADPADRARLAKLIRRIRRKTGN